MNMKYKLITIDKLHVFDTHIHSMSHGALMKVFTTEEVMKLIDKCAARKVQTICHTDHIPLPTTEIDPTPDKDCGLPMQHFIDVLVTIEVN